MRALSPPFSHSYTCCYKHTLTSRTRALTRSPAHILYILPQISHTHTESEATHAFSSLCVSLSFFFHLFSLPFFRLQLALLLRRVLVSVASLRCVIVLLTLESGDCGCLASQILSSLPFSLSLSFVSHLSCLTHSFTLPPTIYFPCIDLYFCNKGEELNVPPQPSPGRPPCAVTRLQRSSLSFSRPSTTEERVRNPNCVLLRLGQPSEKCDGAIPSARHHVGSAAQSLGQLAHHTSSLRLCNWLSRGSQCKRQQQQ